MIQVEGNAALALDWFLLALIRARIVESLPK